MSQRAKESVQTTVGTEAEQGRSARSGGTMRERVKACPDCDGMGVDLPKSRRAGALIKCRRCGGRCLVRNYVKKVGA